MWLLLVEGGGVTWIAAPLTGLKVKSRICILIRHWNVFVLSLSEAIPAPARLEAHRLRVIPYIYSLSDVRKDEWLWRVWTFPGRGEGPLQARALGG